MSNAQQKVQVMSYKSLVVALINVPITSGFMKRFERRPFADWLKRNDVNNTFQTVKK